MKKFISKISLIILLVIIQFSICACQTDFSKPADYVININGVTTIFSLDLPIIKNPGDSQTIVFEINNKYDKEIEYNILVSSLGVLPYVFDLDTDQAEVDGASACGTILKNEKHRYNLTVSWPVEENNYMYFEQTDIVSIKLDVVK